MVTRDELQLVSKAMFNTKKRERKWMHINIELVSFKRVINVIGDSIVIKKILKEGDGAFTANEGAVLIFSYTTMLEDGIVFEKRGIDETQPLKMLIDEEVADASKFLHMNEKENNGGGIITQCNFVKEYWDMDVDKSLVLPSKNKECQKHTANNLQVSEDQKIENPLAQPPLPPKPPDICCRRAAAMRYIVSDCD